MPDAETLQHSPAVAAAVLDGCCVYHGLLANRWLFLELVAGPDAGRFSQEELLRWTAVANRIFALYEEEGIDAVASLFIAGLLLQRTAATLAAVPGANCTVFTAAADPRGNGA